MVLCGDPGSRVPMTSCSETANSWVEKDEQARRKLTPRSLRFVKANPNSRLSIDRGALKGAHISTIVEPIVLA
jgi:hypothetical protein